MLDGMEMLNPLNMPVSPAQENKTVCDTLNRSYTQFHHAKLGGIPQAFILNVSGAALLIVVFSLLRRRAGDYARLALNHDTWNELFWDDRVSLGDFHSSPDIKSRNSNDVSPGVIKGNLESPRDDLASKASGKKVEAANDASPGKVNGVAKHTRSPSEESRHKCRKSGFKASREDMMFRSVDADDIEEIDPTSSKYNQNMQDTSSQPAPMEKISEANNNINNNNDQKISLKTNNRESREITFSPTVAISDKDQQKQPDKLLRPKRKRSAASILAHRSSRLLRLESPRRQDDGFFSWIMVTIRLSDAQYRERVGPDAVQYLTFQRYLIGVVCTICPISLIVMLPTNLLGNNLDNRADPLAFTTISNLSDNSFLLFIPSAFCVLYIIVIITSMRHFTANMPFKSQFKTNAVMITNINVQKSNHAAVTSEDVQSYLNSVYPEVRIEVTMAYNVQKMAKYLKKLEYLSLALEYCEQYNSNKSERLRMVPRVFGVLASCLLPSWCLCGSSSRVDAQEYYQKRVEKLQHKVDRERKSLKSKPLGIAFVVLPSFQIAKRLVEDFKLSSNRNFKKHPQQDLGAEFWNVKLSPPKKDIIWENLQNIGPTSFLRGCLVNFLYVILFIFVSTPAVLLAWFETFDRSTAGIQDKAIEKSSLLGFMIPPFLFVSVAVFMPYLIFLLDDLRSHWKLSTLNLRVMTKTYIYLLFMVVILPSIGLTSIYKFIDSVVLKSEKVRWDCMFLIDNGAFFTNYVITAGLGGLCMELMRVTDLVLYGCRLLMMKSKAERKPAIKSTLLEFPYGFMYAYQLTVMTTVIAYSILCPLITPFGVIYMFVRHFVDRYNIYFSYAPSRISQNCHYRAVSFVILSSVVMLITLLAFSWIRFGKSNWNTIFLIVCACLLGLFLIAKHVVQLLRNFRSRSDSLSLDVSHEHTLDQGTAESEPMNEENLGEITRFDCPFLTFKPTWLSRHASSSTLKLARPNNRKEQESKLAENCNETHSFTFDIQLANQHADNCAANKIGMDQTEVTVLANPDGVPDTLANQIVDDSINENTESQNKPNNVCIKLDSGLEVSNETSNEA